MVPMATHFTGKCPICFARCKMDMVCEDMLDEPYDPDANGRDLIVIWNGECESKHNITLSSRMTPDERQEVYAQRRDAAAAEARKVHISQVKVNKKGLLR